MPGTCGIYLGHAWDGFSLRKVTSTVNGASRCLGEGAGPSGGWKPVEQASAARSLGVKIDALGLV